MRVLTLVLLCLLGVPTMARNANLIRNGDFETESTVSPPPGWVMWGAEQYKKPQNYTRDTNNPHSGKASLRIHHPANTAGYIVASPHNNAVATRQGMTYLVSFWAKADKPGSAQFQVQGYNSIQPMAGYSAPATHLIDVGTDWKKFSFELTESLDFFADVTHYLVLAFNAGPSGVSGVEKTLWIDDVTVEEKPSPGGFSLLNLDTVPYSPLQHRLQPGEALDITVDASRKLRRATRRAGAASFHRLAGYMNLPYNKQGEYRLTPAQETAIRDMRLPHTRFYGVGHEPFSLEQALDKAAHVLGRTGIPQDGTVLELEEQGATRRLSPEVWARAASYAQRQGYGFRHWEVANEPWIHREGRTAAFPTPQDYVAHVKEVSTAIRHVQPASQIGVGIHPGDLRWGNLILKAAAGHYDFVAGHWYSFIDVSKNPFEAIVAGENYRILDQMLRCNALLRAYNPGREVYQYDTEWSLHSMASGGAGTTLQNGNIVGALHRAVRLIYYLREDIVGGASAWEMFSNAGQWNALGILPPDNDKRSMLYWMHRTFNEHTGEWVLEMEGTTPHYQPQPGSEPRRAPLAGPLAPAIVMLSDDGKTMYVIAANASWSRSIPCTLRLRNFNVNSASGLLLSHADVNGHPLLEKKEDFVSDLTLRANTSTLICTLPPHAVAFMTLRR